MPSFLLTNRLVAENDLHLAVAGRSTDGFDAGVFRRLGLTAVNPLLEAAHGEQNPADDQGPREQDDQKEDLITRHSFECRIR